MFLVWGPRHLMIGFYFVRVFAVGSSQSTVVKGWAHLEGEMRLTSRNWPIERKLSDRQEGMFLLPMHSFQIFVHSISKKGGREKTKNCPTYNGKMSKKKPQQQVRKNWTWNIYLASFFFYVKISPSEQTHKRGPTGWKNSQIVYENEFPTR